MLKYTIKFSRFANIGKISEIGNISKITINRWILSWYIFVIYSLATQICAKNIEFSLLDGTSKFESQCLPFFLIIVAHPLPFFPFLLNIDVKKHSFIRFKNFLWRRYSLSFFKITRTTKIEFVFYFRILFSIVALYTISTLLQLFSKGRISITFIRNYIYCNYISSVFVFWPSTTFLLSFVCLSVFSSNVNSYS